MPALNKQIMVQLAKQRFATLTSQPAVRKTAPTVGRALPLTPTPSLTRSSITLGAARVANVDLSTTIEPICHAICQAHEVWRPQASVVDVVINGPVASLGKIVGPDLAPSIRTFLSASPQAAPAGEAGNAIAAGLGEAWTAYMASFSVPGLPWYPTFAAVPSPMAPPTPNVTTPLAAMTCRASLISPSSLQQAMARHLGNKSAPPQSEQLFDAIATGFHMAVTTWVAAQPVSNVMGKGPVPSFAPPYVPVGPVVHGDTLKTPGHLAA